MGTIRVGISGWSYDGWRGEFFPQDLPRGDELGFAASVFPTIEINATFYSLREPSDFRRWREATPRGFRYAVKGSRFITHTKKLAGVRGALANFLASGVLELGDRLGPILWQLPATHAFDEERIDAFLDLLPNDTDEAGRLARDHDDRLDEVRVTPDRNRRVRHVLEPRHESFFTAAAARVLRRHGVALAFSHGSEWPYAEELTAGFVYLRLHGPDELYASAYGDAALADWARRIRAWRRGGEPDDARRLTVRTPPRRKERDVYVYFDNDQHAHAPREARELSELLEGK